MTTSSKSPEAKTEILDAAARCFMHRGASDTSIDDIANALGATKGRIYHHFESKGSLLASVCLRATSLTMTAVQPIAKQRTAPAEKFVDMSTAHVNAILQTLEYHKVVIQNYSLLDSRSGNSIERELFEEAYKQRKAYEDLFRAVLKQGMRTGELQKQPLSVALHSVLLLLNSPVFWYSQRTEDNHASQNRIAKQVARLASQALKP